MKRLIAVCLGASLIGYTLRTVESTGAMQRSASRAEAVVYRGGDGKVTAKYTAALLDAWRLFSANIRLSDGAISAVVRSADSCRGVASQAPLDALRLRVGVVIVDILDAAAVSVDAGIASRLLTRIKRLRWTNYRITNTVHRAVDAVVAEAHLKVPSLCEPLRQWASSDFTQMPPRWRRFRRDIALISHSGTFLPSAMEQYQYTGRQRTEREIWQLQRFVANEIIAHVLQAQKEVCRIVGLGDGKTSYRRRSRAVYDHRSTIFCP